MAMAEDIVFEISGNTHLGCYEALSRAVEISYEYLPAQSGMNELSAAVVPKLKDKKNAQSVARALARATEDAWDHGGQAILRIKYGFQDKPSPKELIFTLARNINKPVEYRLWKQKSSEKCGIIAKYPNENYWMASTSIFNDERSAAAIVQILNQTQTPMEQFRKLIVTSQILNIANEYDLS